MISEKGREERQVEEGRGERGLRRMTDVVRGIGMGMETWAVTEGAMGRVMGGRLWSEGWMVVLRTKFEGMYIWNAG